MKEKEKKNTDRNQTKLNVSHVMYNVKILSQLLIIRHKLSKLEKVHAFQKKIASNELNIFFLNKIEEDFLRQIFDI